MLLDKKQQKRKGAQEVLAALSFLEVEERTGRMSLDVTEFRYVVTRFCELAGLNADEVPLLLHWQFALSLLLQQCPAAERSTQVRGIFVRRCVLFHIGQ